MASNVTGSQWCNNCTACMSEGCYDRCGLTGIAEFFAFAALVVACGLGCAALIAVGSCLRTRVHNIGAKPGEETPPPSASGLMPLVLVIVAAGVPQVVTQFYGLYSNPTGDASSSRGLSPPCIESSHVIGLWASSYDRTPTADFLAPCPSGTMAPFEAMRGTSAVALLCSILGCFLLLAVPTPIPAAIVLAVHAVFLIITGAQAEALYVAGDFCGSGRSIEELGFQKSGGTSSVWAALIMVCAGAVFTVILRCTRPDCFAVPEPQPEPQVAGPVTGHVVVASAPGQPQPYPPQQQYPPQPPQQQPYGHQHGYPPQQHVRHN